MPFQAVPLNLVGATSENRSHQALNELTKNWYPELTPNGLSDAVLQPWLGSKDFGSTAGLDRGIHKFKGVLYRVVDQTLISEDSDGVATTIGTIEGTQRCLFSNSVVGSLNQMVITAGKVYTYDESDLVDTGLTADCATYLNSKTIYPNGGFNFSVSGAGGPASITSSGSAESETDDLLRPYAFNQWAYMFGVETIEPFYDTGATTGVPLSRIDSAIMQKGLGGLYTVANTDQALYFLGDDSSVYKIVQSQLTPISTPDIVNSIKGLDKDKAVGYTITYNEQNFYFLWFPTGLTYVYMEEIGEWITFSTGVDAEPYLVSSYIKIYDKHIGVDYRTGKSIELSDTTYDDLGEVLQRRRVLPPFTSLDVGLPYGQRLTMSKIKFALQTGVGLASGQGSDPKIMVEYSLDGGDNWSTERWLEIGRMGKHLINVEFWEMVSFYEITFRITISDPVFCSLHTAAIDVKAGGY